MNRYLVFLVLTGVLFFCGCDGQRYGWYKYGASSSQISRDSRECLRQAENEHFARDFEGAREAELRGLPHAPYDERGYRNPEYEIDRPAVGRSYNINRCMKDKGYIWTRLDD